MENYLAERYKAFMRVFLENSATLNIGANHNQVAGNFVRHPKFISDRNTGNQGCQNFFSYTKGTSFFEDRHTNAQLLGDGDPVSESFKYKAKFQASLPFGIYPEGKVINFHYSCVCRFEDGVMTEMSWRPVD